MADDKVRRRRLTRPAYGFLVVCILIIAWIRGGSDISHIKLRPDQRWNVTTVAGKASRSSTDDERILFDFPYSLSYGPAGLFVSDCLRHVIRKVSSDGQAVVYAGREGDLDYRDGSLPTARFCHPHGLAQDQVGSLYVADSFNHVIRKISPKGKVTTFAGGRSRRENRRGMLDGPSLRAAFRMPIDLAVVDDIVYVTDSKNHCIRRIQNGEVNTLCGNVPLHFSDGIDGFGPRCTFICPRAIAANREAIYVSDIPMYPAEDMHTCSHLIRKISPNGEVIRWAGGPEGDEDGTRVSSKMRFPQGLALGPSGHLYIADTLNHKIRRLSPRGKIVTLFGGHVPSHRDGIGKESLLDGPHGLAIDHDNRQIFVTELGNHDIRRATLVDRQDIKDLESSARLAASTTLPEDDIDMPANIDDDGEPGQYTPITSTGFMHR